MTGPRAWAFAAAVTLLATGCASSQSAQEGLDAATMPPDVRSDYALFAHRCSKCHSLSRPLNRGFTDDREWSLYVARMRRQPASGISQDDATVILRFLHYYSLEKRRKQEKPASSPGSALSQEARPW